MNREIKFRTWQENKMFFHQLENYLGSTGIVNPYVGCENAIWMQHTGLKDKNGKDIYEGDIVKWYINDLDRIAPVYYDELAACFWMGKEIKLGYTVLNDWMRGEYEVIGNIYENPELLK